MSSSSSELVFDVRDARLAHPLLVFGCVVLGVLLEITVIASNPDFLGDFRPLRFERIELGGEGGMPFGGHRNPVHLILVNCARKEGNPKLALGRP
jgi:hypothetical protein